MKDPKKLIEASIETAGTLLGQVEELVRIARLITVSVRGGGRIYLMGNGGSAADAQHIAAEFVGRFELDRAAVSATAFTTDSSVLTSLSNDFGYDIIFERQVEAHVRHGDIVIGITTSGTSSNIAKALDKAKELGASTVLFTGEKWRKAGGKRVEADAIIVAGSENTARVQESHIIAAHVICSMVEDELFGTS